MEKICEGHEDRWNCLIYKIICTKKGFRHLKPHL